MTVGVTAKIAKKLLFVWPLFVRICPGFNSESRTTRIYMYMYICIYKYIYIYM